MGDWKPYAICTGCGAQHYAPFASLFHVMVAVCPKCGEPKIGWPIRTMRWVGTAQFWRPSTWGSGYWETRGAPNHG